MRGDEMADRAKAIRLPTNRLAALAGVNKHTAGAVMSGRRDMLLSTATSLEVALIAEERRLLSHLQSLHPQQRDVKA